ncbi:hypothetical protein [Vannielia litorea]|uniref:hypothetical protein n=1 Tax=Vannielia litorea TaxID=1217970 RepID=UPI001BCF3C45|nr:hypothetical protein [Vannielia litorea]MBS8227922.1 hypothetical protein [Vannielia litorea]
MKVGKANLRLEPLALFNQYLGYYPDGLKYLGYRQFPVALLDCASHPTPPNLPNTIPIPSFTSIQLPLTNGKGKLDRPGTKARAVRTGQVTGHSTFQQVIADVAKQHPPLALKVPRTQILALHNSSQSRQVIVWPEYLPYAAVWQPNRNKPREVLFTVCLPIGGTYGYIDTYDCQLGKPLQDRSVKGSLHVSGPEKQRGAKRLRYVEWVTAGLLGEKFLTTMISRFRLDQLAEANRTPRKWHEPSEEFWDSIEDGF